MFGLRKRIVLSFFGVLLGLLVLAKGTERSPQIQEASSIASGSWGLSFHEDGKVPNTNIPADKLKEYSAYYLGDEKKKKIYLTFDAGYENGNTEMILDALKTHGVSAAFFLVGNYLETSPELVKRMCEEGHIVGNHTYMHPDMDSIETQEEFLKELKDLEMKFQEITGMEMKKYYRPPQGKYSENHLKWAKEAGYKTIFWSLAYVDWDVKNQPTREEAIEKLRGRIHPGSIVLLHSTSETNAKVLDEILSIWEEMGYTFGSLDELQ